MEITPFTVNRDGNIYSALWKPGRLEINRQSPDGKVSAVRLDGATNAAIGSITGMASGPDGSLFESKQGSHLSSFGCAGIWISPTL